MVRGSGDMIEILKSRYCPKEFSPDQVRLIVSGEWLENNKIREGCTLQFLLRIRGGNPDEADHQVNNFFV